MDSPGLRYVFTLLVVASFCAINGNETTTAAGPETELGFPMTLYHVHVSRAFPVDEMTELSQDMGIRFGVVDNFGRHYRNYSDEHLRRYLARMGGKPFDVGIQAEGRDWMNVFSRDLLSRCDFILADGMTFPNTDGTYSRLWINAEVKISDVQFFMDRYTDYLVDITSEPIDIIANLTYLPESIRDDYENLWSEERTMKIVRAAVANDVAIEINSTYRIPSMTFLKRAKTAGARFAFGANSHSADDTRDISYCIETAKALRLTENDMFVPAKVKKITTHK